MDDGVTKAHFDDTIGGLRKEFITKEHFDATIGGLRREFVTKEHFDATLQKYVTKEHFDATVGSIHEEIGTLRQEMYEGFEKFVTKDEFHNRMDEMIVILRRIDQDRVFTVDRVRQLETDVSRIKTHLHLT